MAKQKTYMPLIDQKKKMYLFIFSTNKIEQFTRKIIPKKKLNTEIEYNMTNKMLSITVSCLSVRFAQNLCVNYGMSIVSCLFKKPFFLFVKASLRHTSIPLALLLLHYVYFHNTYVQAHTVLLAQTHRHTERLSFSYKHL